MLESARLHSGQVGGWVEHSSLGTSDSTPPMQLLGSIVAAARLSAAACLPAAASQRAVSSKVSGFPKHEKNESEGVDRELSIVQFRTNVRMPGHYFGGQEASRVRRVRQELGRLAQLRL